jgi:ParB family chromosome partitioning protein
MEDTDMTTAVTKITLSASRNIPFTKLVLSQSNVRRIKAGISIEALARRRLPTARCCGA